MEASWLLAAMATAYPSVHSTRVVRRVCASVLPLARCCNWRLAMLGQCAELAAVPSSLLCAARPPALTFSSRLQRPQQQHAQKREVVAPYLRHRSAPATARQQADRACSAGPRRGVGWHHHHRRHIQGRIPWPLFQGVHRHRRRTCCADERGAGNFRRLCHWGERSDCGSPVRGPIGAREALQISRES